MKIENIILFDIDWTLLSGTGSTFVEAHRYALKNVLGVNLETDFDISPHEGKTGSQFLVDLAYERGVEKNMARRNLDQMIDQIILFLTKNKNKFDIKPMSAVYDCLNNLKKSAIGLGILTGNFRKVAQLKLEMANLSGYFDFGSYGNESEDRQDLVEIAQRRAERLYSTTFLKDNIFLIGDSWRDIDCGRRAGIKTIGITTGPFNRKALRDHGANLVIDSLSEYDKIVKFIENEQKRKSSN